MERIFQVIFSVEKKKWVIYDPSDEEKLANESNRPKNMSILSLNVLFDEIHGKVYKPNIVYSNDRYEYQIKKFEEISPSILCLNEVTENYIKLLQKSPWIRKNYLLLWKKKDNFDYFQNVICTKIPFSQGWCFGFKNLGRESVIGVFKDNLTVCCSHLSAYKKNFKRRGIELNELYELFDKNLPNNNVLILGDLNFHSEKENVNIRDDYIDVYKTIHSDDFKKGFTFDAKKNLMIYQLWPFGYIIGFDSKNIQMRLDRHLLKAKDKDKINIKDIKIVFNMPVFYDKGKKIKKNYTNFFVDASAALGDLFEKNFWRKKENYLFSSDHFGLLLLTEFE